MDYKKPYTYLGIALCVVFIFWLLTPLCAYGMVRFWNIVAKEPNATTRTDYQFSMGELGDIYNGFSSLVSALGLIGVVTGLYLQQKKMHEDATAQNELLTSLCQQSNGILEQLKHQKTVYEETKEEKEKALEPIFQLVGSVANFNTKSQLNDTPFSDVTRVWFKLLNLGNIVREVTFESKPAYRFVHPTLDVVAKNAQITVSVDFPHQSKLPSYIHIFIEYKKLNNRTGQSIWILDLSNPDNYFLVPLD